MRTEIEQVRPSLPEGVEIELIDSIATELSIVNRTDEVLDAEGASFLRIGPDGAEADFNSPAWVRSNDPTGQAGLPEGVAQDPPQRFLKVAREPSWSLFDPPPGSAGGRQRPRRGAGPGGA